MMLYIKQLLLWAEVLQCKREIHEYLRIIIRENKSTDNT